jgi:two-component sensor histidine kinase
VPIEKRIGKKAGATVNLKDFSFARNPKGTLGQIRKVARLAAQNIGIRVNFTDQRCDDVAPYMVLAQMMKALPPVFSGGLINREVATVLESVGLDRTLGVNRLARQNSPFPILPFKMVYRAPPGVFGDDEHQLRPQYKEFVADRFCSAMDAWLEAKGFELTSDGAQSLIVSITEALDNAERHGCPEIDQGMGDWSMGGFARIILDDSDIRHIECSVAIVSIGSTVSESLATASPAVSALVDGYASLQTAKHSLDMGLGRTIAALQDGITRDEAASVANRGGIGFLTLADVFASLGETDQAELQSVFTILSGTSCLRLTPPYQRGVAAPGDSLRKLWFNVANDGHMKPDANHAFKIEDDFPGTILSASFCIDPGYLRRNLPV